MTPAIEIWRWAQSYRLGAFNGKNMIVALGGYAAYFDASREGSKEIMVAGYVSTLEEWAQFEAGWKLTLAKFDFPYFHTKEFAVHQGAFKHPKWQSESYRISFLSDLVRIIKGWTTANVACRMEQRVFDKYNAIYELDKRFNPYAICGRDCAAQVRKFIREECNPDLPIAYVFERGDEGRGFLMAEMEASGLPSPAFKRGRPNPKNPDLDKEDPFLVQLQACDFAAWELRRRLKDTRLGKGGTELRKSLRHLAGMRHIWKETKESDLKGLIQSGRNPETEIGGNEGMRNQFLTAMREDAAGKR
jgi:hypothetical protein